MRTLAFTFACATALIALPVQAQSANNSAPASPLWEVHLNLQKTFASPLGQRIVNIIERDEPEAIEHFTKLAEAIGLDPRTDIGEVAVFGDGFGETEHTVVASLGQSTGNLEGWILAAPGYRSEDLDSNTLLHSMIVEKHKARAWFALPQHQQSGNYVLVGSLDQDRTKKLARSVLAGNATPIPNPLQGNTLLSFTVNDLSAVPIDIDDDDPGSAVIKTIKQFGLSIGSDEDILNVSVDLTASNAARAKQISALLEGLKAMLQLVDDHEAQMIAKLIEPMVVEHTEGQSQVKANLSAPYSLLENIVVELK